MSKQNLHSIIEKTKTLSQAECNTLWWAWSALTDTELELLCHFVMSMSKKLDDANKARDEALAERDRVMMAVPLELRNALVGQPSKAQPSFHPIASVVKSSVPPQVELDEESKRVLFENLWNLYK